MRFLITVILLFTSTIYFSQEEENSNVEPASNSHLNKNADSTKLYEQDKNLELIELEDEGEGSVVEDDDQLQLNSNLALFSN